MRIVICDDCRANVTGEIPREWLTYVEITITGEVSPIIDICDPCSRKPFRRRYFKICGLREIPKTPR